MTREKAIDIKQQPSDDCVSRANLISKLEILERRYGSDFYWETRKIVDKLPSVNPQEPKWIPVSERLPTKEEYIANSLFIVSDGSRTYAEYFDIYCSMRFGEPTIRGFRVDYAVTAWMPLPPRYKPQESEE